MKARACGTECGLCCTVFTIPELDKQAGERCVHLTEKNQCGIYPEDGIVGGEADLRPAQCQEFSCGYFENRNGKYLFPDIHPSRLGAMIRAIDSFTPARRGLAKPPKEMWVHLTAPGDRRDELPPVQYSYWMRKFLKLMQKKIAYISLEFFYTLEDLPKDGGTYIYSDPAKEIEQGASYPGMNEENKTKIINNMFDTYLSFSLFTKAWGKFVSLVDLPKVEDRHGLVKTILADFSEEAEYKISE
jgi:hypothetical protein